MNVNWAEVNDRRISEITQEIHLYCAQKKSGMTPRSFELAQISFGRLLDNIIDRDQKFAGIPETVRRSMDAQDDCVAVCSEKQAAVLARSIVYNYIGDDLNLYPVRAEQKLLRSKVRGIKSCNIPIDEMTDADKFYIAYAFSQGECFTKPTMMAVFNWFRQFGFDPICARVYSIYRFSNNPLNIRSLPQQSMFLTEYRRAVEALVKDGYLRDVGGNNYIISEKTLS